MAVTSAPQLPSSEEYSGGEYGGLSVEPALIPYPVAAQIISQPESIAENLISPYFVLKPGAKSP